MFPSLLFSHFLVETNTPEAESSDIKEEGNRNNPKCIGDNYIDCQRVFRCNDYTYLDYHRFFSSPDNKILF